MSDLSTYRDQADSIVGWKRTPDGKPAPVFRAPRTVVDRARNRTATADAIIRRAIVPLDDARHPGRQILEAGAPHLLQHLRDAASAEDEATVFGAQDHFLDDAQDLAEDIERRARKRTMTAVDSQLYTLLAPLLVLPMVVERIQAEPSLVNILPKMALNTPLEDATYLRVIDHMPAPERSWSWTQKSKPQGSITLQTVPIRLAPSSTGFTLTARDREVFDATRGNQGAPTWGLYERLVENHMRAVRNDIAAMVAFGEPAFGINGVLTPGYVTAANVNYDTGVSLTDYQSVADIFVAQAAQVGQIDQLKADTLLLDAATFSSWSMQLLSNTGDDRTPVLTALLDNPQIARVYSVREFMPIAAEITEGTPKYGVPEATRLGGGLLNGGTYHKCLMVTRLDERVHLWIEGLPLGVEALDVRDGADRAQVRSSTGGYVQFQNVSRIAYI